MRILLVEPDYRRLNKSTKLKSIPKDDNVRWYPPLGLLKLSRFHKNRGDSVSFSYGCAPNSLGYLKSSINDPLPFFETWDRIYITTLFTYQWKRTIEVIRHYIKVAGGARTKVYIGGVMASLMPEDLFEATGIYPIKGLLESPSMIGLDGNENIDRLAPDYSILDSSLYAIKNTYYAYTSRGCVNNCPWCGVPCLEPDFIPYIDIKPVITQLREEYGDKSVLKLMDNNILASNRLEEIVADLIELGYGRGEYTASHPKKQRVLDFNQGLDAKFLTENQMKLLSLLNIRPMRIAFDRYKDKDTYKNALNIAKKYGVKSFSNYMLFNFQDTPRDLYDRFVINIHINERWRNQDGTIHGTVFSYPMRYAPINERDTMHGNRKRDYHRPEPDSPYDYLYDARWNARFVRNIGIMSGAAHGSLSPTPSLAWRTIGETYEEFIANLYMPEELLRNRNRYEHRVYSHEPPRIPGSGDVEKFRDFIYCRIKNPDDAFNKFHLAVSKNRKQPIRDLQEKCKDREVSHWLKFYLMK